MQVYMQSVVNLIAKLLKKHYYPAYGEIQVRVTAAQHTDMFILQIYLLEILPNRTPFMMQTVLTASAFVKLDINQDLLNAFLKSVIDMADIAFMKSTMESLTTFPNNSIIGALFI